MTPQELFVLRFNECLRERNLKQSDLVNQLGLHRASVSSYASGAYMPKSNTLAQLAQLFHVSPSWLAGFSPEKYDRNAIVGQKMKERRLQLGMSLKEVAEALDYHNEFSIDKIEKGVNSISVAELARVASVLDCTPNYLLDFEPPNNDSKFKLSDKEKCIVLSYRSKPEIQKAVDMLLEL